ncbi:MAG: hypothetical protein ACT4PZ_16070 [Panacagrimonas sp.]
MKFSVLAFSIAFVAAGIGATSAQSDPIGTTLTSVTSILEAVVEPLALDSENEVARFSSFDEASLLDMVSIDQSCPNNETLTLSTGNAEGSCSIEAGCSDIDGNSSMGNCAEGCVSTGGTGICILR